MCLTSLFLFLLLCIEPATVANSKSAAIEMYAPSSYNDTVTGETLSSVSDKSDSYSNDGSQPDLTVRIFQFFFGIFLWTLRENFSGGFKIAVLTTSENLKFCQTEKKIPKRFSTSVQF